MTGPLIGAGYSGLPDPGAIESELKDGPRDELLICADCQTIEHIPGFDGPPEYNSARLARFRNHVVDLADGTATTHSIAFTTVNAKLWRESDDFRRHIVKAINDAQKTGNVGLGQQMYDLRSTYQEDAMTCWRIGHNRTQNCEDYMSDKKRLVQNDDEIRALRREAGTETRTKYIQANAFLCQFCPYHSIVMERKRKAEGFY